jgi:hypothetical protein
MNFNGVTLAGMILILLAAWWCAGRSQAFGDMPAGRSIVKSSLFWKKVYSEIDSTAIVLFDRSSLKIFCIAACKDSARVLDSLQKAVRHPQRIKAKRGRKEFIREALARAQNYPFIADTLEKYGLHPDLKWLPVLESGYLDTLVSDQGAKGIWQFIRTTGAKYGLSDGDIIDPVASTSAFARYFSALFREFNDYGLALTAYNHGEEGIRRILKKRNAKSLDEILPNLGFESRNYYARFLSILDIAKNTRNNDAPALPDGPAR